ncbi:MAG TPA: DUF2231 domain-containing protein [Xanthobacteraceae bacterium]|jgi:uncharacterized membrane protein|nr:DUF2231 domain-containing protein [Xanthobacteraceae bacterium]
MATRNPVSSAQVAEHPLHPMLVPLVIGFFVGALLLDLVFWNTSDAAYATGALWLLGFGLIAAALAAIAGATDFFGDQQIRAITDAWHHAIGNVIVVLIELFNFYWRYRYGPSGVLPLGLLLSVVAVAILIFTGWKGGEMVYRHRIGVIERRD